MTDHIFDNLNNSYLTDVALGNINSPKKDLVFFSRLISANKALPEMSKNGALIAIAKELNDANPLMVDTVAEMVKIAKLGSKCAFKAAVSECKQKKIHSNESNEMSMSQKFKQPSDDELFNRWIISHPDTAYGLGKFRRFKNGIWPEISEKEIMNEIFDELVLAKGDENIKPSYPLLRNITELAKVLTSIPDDQWDSDVDLLPCKNGLLRLSNRELIPHDSSYHFTSGLDYAYDPKANCPNFIRTLESAIPDAMQLFIEFMGYCLTTETKEEKALLLYGAPGCGKSTILVGVQSMLGPRVGELGLRDLEQSHFTTPLIIGKSCLLSTEQPAGYLSICDLVNKIISGESIGMERKYEAPFSYTPIAKIIWAVNDLFKVRNAESNGIFRRLMVIKFNPLEKSLRNVDLKDLIKNERAGILNRALDGLDSYKSRGKFIIPPSVILANNEFLESNDYISKFISEKCIKELTLQIQSSVFYDAYSAWCIENGYEPKSNRGVADDLTRLNLSKHKSDGRVFWKGIDMKM